jgi:hypothetical protein
MKRVLVALVSICLIGGMAALIPLLAGDPASAVTPCAAQHAKLVRVERHVRRDRAMLAKDRRHHRAAAVKRDKRKLAADRHRAHDARLRLSLCRANHKPARTKTVTPSPTTSGPGVGLPTDLPTILPTDLPTTVPSCLTLPPISEVPTPTLPPLCL